MTKIKNLSEPWSSYTYPEVEEFIKSNLQSNILDYTWKELKDLRDSKKLIPGIYYRITDYVCPRSRKYISLEKGLNIILLAIGQDKFSESALATNNEKTYRILYCLDNDSSRFSWAVPDDGETYEFVLSTGDIISRSEQYDMAGFYAWIGGDIYYTKFENVKKASRLYTTSDGSGFTFTPDAHVISSSSYSPGKGVIYMMTDENGNSAPFDFLSIVYSDSPSSYNSISAQNSVFPDYMMMSDNRYVGKERRYEFVSYTDGKLYTTDPTDSERPGEVDIEYFVFYDMYSFDSDTMYYRFRKYEAEDGQSDVFNPSEIYALFKTDPRNDFTPFLDSRFHSFCTINPYFHDNKYYLPGNAVLGRGKNIEFDPGVHGVILESGTNMENIIVERGVASKRIQVSSSSCPRIYKSSDVKEILV